MSQQQPTNHVHTSLRGAFLTAMQRSRHEFIDALNKEGEHVEEQIRRTGGVFTKADADRYREKGLAILANHWQILQDCFAMHCSFVALSVPPAGGWSLFTDTAATNSLDEGVFVRPAPPKRARVSKRSHQVSSLAQAAGRLSIAQQPSIGGQIEVQPNFQLPNVRDSAVADAGLPSFDDGLPSLDSLFEVQMEDDSVAVKTPRKESSTLQSLLSTVEASPESSFLVPSTPGPVQSPMQLSFLTPVQSAPSPWGLNLESPGQEGDVSPSSFLCLGTPDRDGR